MGQKVNPLSFRLQTSKAWNSRWFASKKDFAVWLAEDGKIRDLIEKKFSSRPTIAKVEIERSANLVTITIYTAKAGVVIGRGGAGIAELKKEIEAKGGKVAGSVSKNTSYLVTNNPESGSSKNKAAAELGVKIITEDEIRTMLGY